MVGDRLVLLPSGDGGNQTATPLLAAGSWAVGDAASLIGGAGILVSRSSYSHDGHGHSHTDTDPVGFVGVGLGLGSMDLSAALEGRKGEYDTDIGLMLGVAVPLGQSSTVLSPPDPGGPP